MRSFEFIIACKLSKDKNIPFEHLVQMHIEKSDIGYEVIIPIPLQHFYKESSFEFKDKEIDDILNKEIYAVRTNKYIMSNWTNSKLSEKPYVESLDGDETTLF